MTIDLSSVFTDNFRLNRHPDDEGNDGEVRRYTVCLDMDVFESDMGNYRILCKDPFELSVIRTGDTSAEISGNTSIELEIPCDRCLRPVPVRVELTPDIEVDFNDKAADLFADGFSVDVDKLIYPEIVMNLPMKTLCREDCRGICKKCGMNLNEGSCDCDTFVPDPRMSVISDIFKQFNQ